jgi:hypothetical protein
MTAPGAAGGAGISKRRLRAIRLGKPAGTGPTSAAGKARSAQNARKHGLNVPVMHNPDLSAEVEFMAEEIAPGCQDPELVGRARLLAEAQVDLIRVARARRDIISAAMADPNFGPVTGVRGLSESAIRARTNSLPSCRTSACVSPGSIGTNAWR